MNTHESLAQIPGTFSQTLSRAEGFFSPVVLAEERSTSKEPNRRLARDAWQQCGVPAETIDGLLAADNSGYQQNIQLNPEQFLTLLGEADQERLLSKLITIFRPFYEPVQPFLDSNGFNPSHGFNSHTLDHHILPLARRALSLANREPLRTRNEVLLAIFLHDVANAHSRPLHALALRYAIPAMFGTDAVLDGNDFTNTFIAAIAHDERTGVMPIMRALLMDTHPNQLGESGVAQNEQYLLKTMGKPWFYVLLLDKTHLGHERTINTRKIAPEALVEDQHILANMPYSLQSMQLENDGVFRIKYNFNFTREDYLGELPYEKRKEGSGYKLIMPNSLREKYAESNETYFDQITDTVLSLYQERWLIAALSAYIIYGDRISFFEIEFEDSDGCSLPKKKRYLKYSRLGAWQELLRLQRAKA